MPDPARYSYAVATYDLTQIDGAVSALALPGFLGVCGSGGTVQVLFAAPLSGADGARLDAALANYVIDPTLPAKRLRAAADALLSSDPGGPAKATRAVAIAGLDEINGLRSWLTSFVAAVAAATTLQNLQTRVAALPALPQRTKQQLLNVATQHVDDGTAD